MDYYTDDDVHKKRVVVKIILRLFITTPHITISNNENIWSYQVLFYEEEKTGLNKFKIPPHKIY